MIKNLKCTIAPSKIHGVGVFALYAIKKGEKMYVNDGPIWCNASDLNRSKPEIKRIIAQRFPTTAAYGQPFLINDVRLLSYMNHADKPNYDKFYDTALRAIKKGEEVTEDYGEYKEVLLSI